VTRVRGKPPEHELSARLVRPFLRLLRRRGVPIETLLFRGGSLEDPDTRVPHALAIAMLEQAARALGDEAFGLHAAEAVEPGDFDVLEYAAMSSATVGEGIATANRYLRLVHDAAEFTLDTDGTVALWRFQFPPASRLPPMASEYFMAIFSLLGRRYADDEAYEETEVHFTHAAPGDCSEHERIIQRRVRFGQPDNAIVMPASRLDLPMKKADPAMRRWLERVADEMLERLPKLDSITAHVRRVLTAELRGGDPGLERLARRLHTTPRTLRRRLDAAGTTHRSLLEELRKELAFQYLREPSIGVTEVAFLLGYQDASSFHRAFKRWAGTSASEYRRGRTRSKT
jgi:AraC-like DNA-binding protein